MAPEAANLHPQFLVLASIGTAETIPLHQRIGWSSFSNTCSGCMVQNGLASSACPWSSTVLPGLCSAGEGNSELMYSIDGRGVYFPGSYSSHFWHPVTGRQSSSSFGNVSRQSCCTDTQLPYVIGDYNPCNTGTGTAVVPARPSNACISDGISWDGQFCIRNLNSMRWQMTCKRCNDSGSGTTQNGKVMILRGEAQWSRPVTGTPGGTNYCNDSFPQLGDTLTASRKGDFDIYGDPPNDLYRCYSCPYAGATQDNRSSQMYVWWTFQAIDRSEGFTACPHELDWSLVDCNSFGLPYRVNQFSCYAGNGTETINGSIQLTVI